MHAQSCSSTPSSIPPVGILLSVFAAHPAIVIDAVSAIACSNSPGKPIMGVLHAAKPSKGIISTTRKPIARQQR
jgi:hypothetical protein